MPATSSPSTSPPTTVAAQPTRAHSFADRPLPERCRVRPTALHGTVRHLATGRASRPASRIPIAAARTSALLATAIAYGLGKALLRAVYLLPIWPLLAITAAIGLEQLLIQTGAPRQCEGLRVLNTLAQDVAPRLLLALALVSTAWVEASCTQWPT